MPTAASMAPNRPRTAIIWTLPLQAAPEPRRKVTESRPLRVIKNATAARLRFINPDRRMLAREHWPPCRTHGGRGTGSAPVVGTLAFDGAHQRPPIHGAVVFGIADPPHTFGGLLHDVRLDHDR